MIDALEQSRADVSGLPKQLCCNWDQNLLGGNTRRWIYPSQSDIINAPAKRQSPNGLAERAWGTVFALFRAYLTENQMPRDYWV